MIPAKNPFRENALPGIHGRNRGTIILAITKAPENATVSLKLIKSTLVYLKMINAVAIARIYLSVPTNSFGMRTALSLIPKCTMRISFEAFISLL